MSKNRLSSIYIYALGACLAFPAASAYAFGGSAAAWLGDPMAVRPLSLGSAYSALADDEACLNSNPAGLARVEGFRLSGTHGIGVLDVSQEYLAASLSLGTYGSLGLQAGYLFDQDTLRDVFGQEFGAFDNSNLMLGMAWAWPVQGWNIGLGVKGLRESYYTRSSLSLAGDLGVQAPGPWGWKLGAQALNLGASNPENGGGSLSLPTRLGLGAAAPLFEKIWWLALEAQALPLDSQLRLQGGSELNLEIQAADKGAPMVLSLRAGLQMGLIQEEESRPSFGFGLQVPPSYQVDYAYLSSGIFPASHRFSLSLRFLDIGPGVPQSAELAAPFNLTVSEELDGITLWWEDANPKVAGYNIYADYGVLVERLTPKAVKGNFQKFIKVTRGRTYNFYVRPVGSDNAEGPSSKVLTYQAK